MGEGSGKEGAHVYAWLSSFAAHLKLPQHCQLVILQYKMQNRKCEVWKTNSDVGEHAPLGTAPPPVRSVIFSLQVRTLRLARGGQLVGDRAGIPPRAVMWPRWAGDPGVKTAVEQTETQLSSCDGHRWWHVLLNCLLHFHVMCYFSPLENPCAWVHRARVHPLLSSSATLCLSYWKHPARSCGKLKE